MTRDAETNEIVIQFRIARDECPRLFENLANVEKGLRRASRLKVLVIRGFDAEVSSANISARPVVPEDSSSSSSQSPPLNDLIDGKMEA